MLTQEMIQEFRKARQHQVDVWANGGGSIDTFGDGTKERQSFGGAPFGEHAISAFMSARRAVNFRNRMNAELSEHKKRSAAAKRGWKQRKSVERSAN